MDFSGNLVEKDRGVDTYKETAIHRLIYRNRDDVNAVVHHHAPPVIPFTITDVKLRPAFHMGAIFHSGVPTFDAYDPEFGRLIVSDAEGQRMADVLGDHRAQLLEGHGANVVGSSIEETICSTVYFVKNAQYQFQAEQLGDPSFYERPDDSSNRW